MPVASNIGAIGRRRRYIVGAVGLVAGVALAAALVLGRAPLGSRFLVFVPFALGRPVWVDDPHFNIGYHVRRTALPGPGGDAERRALGIRSPMRRHGCRRAGSREGPRAPQRCASHVQHRGIGQLPDRART